MTDLGRANLKKIFDSAPYKAWAAVPANAPEATKVAKAYAGQPFSTPSSKYAQGLCGLCKENPPAGVPIPPDPIVSGLAPVWRQDAAFTNGGLSNFAGPPRERAFQLGWTAVYIQLLHTSYAEANMHEMGLSPWAKWTKVGWGTYGQGSDPELDGKAAADLCRNLGLSGWKANGEAWAEAQYSWKTVAFINGWKAGGSPCPLGWSVLSSDTANFARSFDYAAATSIAGADIDLQVYGATYPTFTVGAGLGMLSKAVPPVAVGRTAMTFDVNGSGTGPFPDYRTWAGPRRLWECEKATVATFDALAR